MVLFNIRPIMKRVISKKSLKEVETKFLYLRCVRTNTAKKLLLYSIYIPVYCIYVPV